MEKYIPKSDFFYELPESKIAFYPLEKRDQSKLLVYKDNVITDAQFSSIDQFIPENATLIFNETKVIPARLIFNAETKANIEIFCLQKISSKAARAEKWLCYVGNAKKWKQEILELKNDDDELRAAVIAKVDDAFEIEFSWNSNKTFYQLLDVFGATPLPPYIKRKAEESDKSTYQTIFSKHEGSVAAPTAALHFTDEVLEKLKHKGVDFLNVTLHVGAGTFKPIKSDNVLEHKMHEEWMELSRNTVEALTANENGNLVPVGTTALRTLETLYWLGVKASVGKLHADTDLYFSQWEYEMLPQDISFKSAMDSLLKWMLEFNMENVCAKTQIMITPSYKIKTAKAIVTNFHQPESTLLLLIAAFVGEAWKGIYKHAMSNDYRFLSYGDSSLLFLNK